MIMFFFLSSSTASAQSKTLSTKDKQVIIDIFKELSQSYYLEFNYTENYGSKSLLPHSLKDAVIKNQSSGQSGPYFFRTHIEMGLWYAVLIASGKPSTLEDNFGKTNASRLQAIINKYGGVTTDK